MIIEHIYQRFLECENISTDTRKITKNSMFFALKGDNFNGNTFAKKALDLGASYCIVDEKEYAKTKNCILVDDVLQTLQHLATFHRKQLAIPIVALTGSNGKTTTKELINAVLSTQFKTSSTQGNLNNHIGVPLTLLKMTYETEIGIVEMGANHHKEIEQLCNIALPDYGLITNFGKAHLEGFGSVEGVIEAKSELYEHLKKHQKTIFVNEDDAIQLKQTNGYAYLKLFGSKTSNGVNLELLTSQPFVSLKYDNIIINSNLAGDYNFNNIAVAIAIGSYFKISTSNIVSAIENYAPTNNRSQIIEQNGNWILMDAYNANPTSMLAALENFKQLQHPNKVLFIGDMFELGADAEKEHQAIVNYLENNPFESVYLIGENFSKTKTTRNDIHQFKLFDDLKSKLTTSQIKDKFILIKGSRGMALERILELI
uniref:UDP-N-acetylmuramoyl-tripeptide--D-alanyl-D- alanine ligase n=1 Tax=Gelidibacter sp. TaxID=2018083 RepID=UPI00404B1D12